MKRKKKKHSGHNGPTVRLSEEPYRLLTEAAKRERRSLRAQLDLWIEKMSEQEQKILAAQTKLNLES